MEDVITRPKPIELLFQIGKNEGRNFSLRKTAKKIIDYRYASRLVGKFKKMRLVKAIKTGRKLNVNLTKKGKLLAVELRELKECFFN